MEDSNKAFTSAQIVRSLAGHDKGELFCVMNTDGAYLLLADGKRRLTQAPKRKKRIHAEYAGELTSPAPDWLAENGPAADRELRRALAAFRAQLRRV